jgi:hypothetical protein
MNACMKVGDEHSSLIACETVSIGVDNIFWDAYFSHSLEDECIEPFENAVTYVLMHNALYSIVRGYVVMFLSTVLTC